MDADQAVTVEVAMTTWWHNIRDSGGLRLTDEGYRILEQVLELENYQFEMDNFWGLNHNILLEMDRKIQSPYYIKRKIDWSAPGGFGATSQVVIFGSAEAMMISLYGDFIQWLDNYQP